MHDLDTELRTIVDTKLHEDGAKLQKEANFVCVHREFDARVRCAPSHILLGRVYLCEREALSAPTALPTQAAGTLAAGLQRSEAAHRLGYDVVRRCGRGNG